MNSLRPDPTAPVPKLMPDGERRAARERRHRVWWSVVYGSFKPRRRQDPRRLDESRYHAVDWHSAHLLAVSIGILLLSAADAFMTVTLLSGGAIEVNPVMAAVIGKSASMFAILKMAMTGVGVTVLVFLARYRFMRVVRVESAMYAVFLVYSTLLGYEYWMLRSVMDIAPL